MREHPLCCFAASMRVQGVLGRPTREKAPGALQPPGLLSGPQPGTARLSCAAQALRIWKVAHLLNH
eukprot:1413090-Pyramimonas_sp.AAC.1